MPILATQPWSWATHHVKMKMLNLLAALNTGVGDQTETALRVGVQPSCNASLGTRAIMRPMSAPSSSTTCAMDGMCRFGIMRK